MCLGFEDREPKARLLEEKERREYILSHARCPIHAALIHKLTSKKNGRKNKKKNTATSV